MATKTAVPHKPEYVNDEYLEKLERFASDRGVPVKTVEQEFRRHCEKLQATFKEDTPVGVTRRIAFHQLEWQS